MSAQKKNELELSKEKREEMISLIKTYFYNDRDEEIGDLAASLILNFIVDKLAPEFYNQGVIDSYKYIGNSIEDLLSIQRY
ncbi:DUF2164 domain-containing protein [Clostridium intestinale]|uniref:Uncharacterized conserved protein, DUF2164 family n=1 Tax=Clostridium intestinale DSM 6191 TaxID=1121320 RepID=A0A1M6FBQ8_9CLOT|nr:DUF2164 domain-containing protein [Clostridium intestinale]SHI95103.1 Uncharacterized conserved protein, DUF2164 family [Clostridium intestinale DSM 6191]